MITLLIISLILLLAIIYYDILVKIALNLINNNNYIIIYINNLFTIINKLFRMSRRFSVFYIVKSQLNNYYIFVPLFILACKLVLDHANSTQYSFPNWFSKLINFFVITAGWELLCFVTKIIDDYPKNR